MSLTTNLSVESVAWIAADWGTTNLRVWAMSGEHQVLAQVSSGDGMATTSPGDFEPLLLALIGPWLAEGRVIPVVACGMVGARQGWFEVPYVQVPCSPIEAGRARQAPCSDPRIQVHIIGGLCQQDPADVMRGEETQVAGLLHERPEFDGLLCMPGTHTKWVHIKHGLVQRFTSWMTGELFSLLSQRSVLQHSVRSSELDMGTFRATVKQALELDQPYAELFGVRANDLLNGSRPEQSRARLSALLIASEVRSLRSEFQDKDVVLLGATDVVELYHAALTQAGVRPETVDGTLLTLAGLKAMHLQSA